MSNSTQTSRNLSHHLYAAKVAGDGKPEWGPWPGMSRRARLIARGLVVAALVIAGVSIDPSLLIVLAFALPFWIAVELEAPVLVSVPARRDVRSSLQLIMPCWSGRDSTPRAA